MDVTDEMQVFYLEEMDGVVPTETHSEFSEVLNDGVYYVNPESEGTDQFLYNEGQGMTVVTHEIAEGVTGVTELLGLGEDDGNKETSCSLTIVPSEVNDAGEVSYVLVIGNPADNKDEEKEDLKVYDFDEDGDDLEEEAQAEGQEETEDIKPLLKKGTKRKKKSQTASSETHSCNYCNYTSPKRYLLYRHIKTHSEERPHKCSVCERGFKTLSSLHNHVNTHTGTKPHKCKYCDAAFTTSGELIRHVRYRHTHEKPHQCSECDYASVELSKLKRHMRCHTGERPYQCPHCTYASPDTFKLKRHLRIHTGEKPYQCDMCPSRFTQSNSLKAHKLIHTGNKPMFKCELCPASCGRKTDLRIHIQNLHTSEKLLKCKRCQKSFPDRYTFKLHSKTHEGEKCFKCDLCSYAASSQRHLESHVLVHTDYKPFECELCDQSFRQKQLLTRHRNLYHDPNYVPPPPREKEHQCSECRRSFRHKGNLIRHMAIHDPESSFHEKALALKLGRQKRIQISDGQHVEVLDDDEDGGQVLAVQGDDGQQYLVLEVIQLQDEDGVEQTVRVVDEDTELSTEVAQADSDIGDLKDSAFMELNEGMHHPNVDLDKYGAEVEGQSRVGITQETVVTEQDVKSCFGFDDDDDDDDESGDVQYFTS